MASSGFYNSDHTVYTITNMFPLRPWRNYLWNERFIASLDQFGCGPSWHRTGEIYSGACNPGDSRLWFVRDRKNGKIWSANRNFLQEPFKEFYCEVGQGFSRIVSCFQDIRISFRLFVPSAGDVECWTLCIENLSSETRSLDLFAYADSDLNKNEHAAYNHGGHDRELNGVVLSHHAYKVSKTLLTHFLAADTPFAGFETTSRRFKGVYGQLSLPAAIQAGQLSSQETSFDQEMILALQFVITLAPGEKKVLNLVNGLATSLEDGRALAKRLLRPGQADAELAVVESRAKASMHKVFIQTPDEDINALTNVWLKRQIDLGKTWARTYTRGFRDIMQDITAFAPLEPDTAAEKIKYCLAYQRPDGNPLRQWEPEDHHPYRDGAAWLILAVTTYLKETGRFDLLDDVVPYLNSSEKGSVLDHCLRGMNFLLDNLGEHGLCLWGGGDWNDSLNGAGLQGRGESIWLTEAAIVAAREFTVLLRRLKKQKEAESVESRCELLVRNLRTHAWDQDHFLCGFNDWGEKVGAHENKEAKLFLNMQTWGVLSGAAENGNALMDLVERELKSPFGYVLNKPCYSKGDNHIGRVSFFEKGCYENGSVYNHGGTFKIAADCLLGRGEMAYATVKMMLPTNKANPAERSGVEPYVMTNMYLGPENSLRAGEALMGWITGAAGWLFRCVTEYMLGIKAEYEGLRIAPCLSSAWKEVSVRREFRGSVYQIRISNAKGLQTGRVSVSVDGRSLEGTLLPVFSDGREHDIKVEIQ